jgi:hypothetical protein
MIDPCQLTHTSLHTSSASTLELAATNAREPLQNWLNTGFIDLYRYMVFEVPGSRLRGDFDFDGELKRGDRIACGGKVYVIRGKTYEMPPFINGLRIEIERKEDEEVEAVLSGQAKELMRLELSSARPPRIFKSSQSACKQISNRHIGVQTDPRYQASEPTK